MLWFMKSIARKCLETVGIKLLSRTSYMDSLASIRSYLPTKGFFIEAGAVDGVFESNTYGLERFEGWSGILIEPSLDMYNRLRFNRPNSKSFNCALVSFDDNGKPIRMNGHHATACVQIANTDSFCEGEGVIGRSLSSILDEVGLASIDFMSLDVEGYEQNVLDGIDFSRHQIKAILVECLTDNDFTAIERYLIGKGYCFEKKVTYRDFFFLLNES